ncbi:MAG TPA: hypothetical protein VMT76_03650 [Puia sp.]|nr:hypothetical protein [Puia sp.]
MKKRIFIVLLFTLAFASLSVLVIPIRISSQQQISVNLPITEVSPEIIDLRNWVKWFPDLAKADSSDINYSHNDSTLRFGGLTLNKNKSNPAYIELTKNINKTITDYSIQLLPDSFGFGTQINWSAQTDLLSWLKSKFSGRNIRSELNNNVNAFRLFAENPKLFFGFNIQVTPVEDTLVMTDYATCKKSEMITTLKSLYRKLEKLAGKNNAYIDSPGKRLAAFALKGRDSIIVMAGFPVQKKLSSHQGIFYLEMPSRGKMLVGDYVGPYQGIHELYKSMDRYVRIRSLSKIATPFEKYLTSPITASDSLHMKIKLFYPIL